MSIPSTRGVTVERKGFLGGLLTTAAVLPVAWYVGLVTRPAAAEVDHSLCAESLEQTALVLSAAEGAIRRLATGPAIPSGDSKSSNEDLSTGALRPQRTVEVDTAAEARLVVQECLEILWWIQSKDRDGVAQIVIDSGRTPFERQVHELALAARNRIADAKAKFDAEEEGLLASFPLVRRWGSGNENIPADRRREFGAEFSQYTEPHNHFAFAYEREKKAALADLARALE